MASKTPVTVLISGSGSNLQALIDACAQEEYPARIVHVISNKADAYGLTRASNAGIPTSIISHRNYDSREMYDAALHEALLQTQCDIVCLAGFMRLLTADFVNKWEHRMLNIHPSLLPDYKGLNTHARVLEDGKTETGCTVHYVTADMDAGPIITQEHVAVLSDDTPKTLQQRVHTAEHIAYVRALREVISAH